MKACLKNLVLLSSLVCASSSLSAYQQGSYFLLSPESAKASAKASGGSALQAKVKALSAGAGKTQKRAPQQRSEFIIELNPFGRRFDTGFSTQAPQVDLLDSQTSQSAFQDTQTFGSPTESPFK